MPFLAHHIQRGMMLIVPCDANLDCLFQVGSVKPLQCKVTVFLFEINAYFMRRNFEIM